MPRHASATRADSRRLHDSDGTRHACEQTNDGDDRPDILISTEPKDRRSATPQLGRRSVRELWDPLH